MASQGPLSAGAGANIAGVDVDWATPGNVTVSDDSYATAALTAGTFSDVLQAQNFGFSIPTGATINGIVFEVERAQDSGVGVVEDDTVYAQKGGAFAGTSHAIAGAWPAGDTYQTYGTSSDLWGATWTPADINASNFGLRLSIAETSTTDAATGRVDHVRCTIYYTPAVARSFCPGLIGL